MRTAAAAAIIRENVSERPPCLNSQNFVHTFEANGRYNAVPFLVDCTHTFHTAHTLAYSSVQSHAHFGALSVLNCNVSNTCVFWWIYVMSVCVCLCLSVLTNRTAHTHNMQTSNSVMKIIMNWFDFRVDGNFTHLLFLFGCATKPTMGRKLSNKNRWYSDKIWCVLWVTDKTIYKIWQR